MWIAMLLLGCDRGWDEPVETESCPSELWYLDADGDGHGDPDAMQVGCEPVEDARDWVTSGDDCDDDDPTIHPDAWESCDGVDQDCDGQVDEDAVNTVNVYLDSDGDGFGLFDTLEEVCTVPEGYAERAGDCDDTNAGAYPGTEEVLGDGIDNDCDDLVDEEAIADLSVAVFSGADDEEAGKAISGAGDINGDGLDDFLIGARYGDVYDRGRVDVIFGPVEGEHALGDGTVFIGDSWGDEAGYDVSGAGDINGDGYDDILISAPENTRGGEKGAVYWILGPLTAGTTDLQRADGIAYGGSVDLNIGRQVSRAGDVNDDGFSDILIAPSGTQDVGAFLLLGPVSGTVSLSDADSTIRASKDSGWHYAYGVGDVTGDGFDDLLLHDEESTHLVYGPTDEDVELSEMDSSSNTFGRWGSADLSGNGDINGDGLGDLIGMSSTDHVIQIFHGAADGVDFTDAAVTIDHSYDIHDFGWSADIVGDVDGDDHEDVLIGAGNVGGPYEDDEDSGILYLFYGPLSGNLDVSAAKTILGGGYNSYTGQSLCGAGDTDGDGLDDILVGAYWANSQGGKVYLIPGANL